MMYWFALTLLALGALLLGGSNPWQFFKAIYGGFFDWTEAFWYLQWGGFWLITASLALFGGAAWRAPWIFTVQWKLIPPAMALLLFVLYFSFSMPEKSNQRDWKSGWLGARVYWRTKLWQRGDDQGEDALPARLSGSWEAPCGVRLVISRDAVRMTTPSGDTEWSARSCSHRFQMEYDFTFRQALTQPLPDGLSFTPLSSRMREPAIPLPDRRFPRLYCSCDSVTTVWVLVDIDRLMGFPESDRVLIARRR